jgi:hypothetical protein
MSESKDPVKTTKDPKKETPRKWDGPNDARKNDKAGKYPNVEIKKTPSGHTLIFDDSNGGEHITLQHRSGAMMQFMPDGAIQFVSHNGQYNFVFGENRVKITGAYDVTVEGGGSLKVDGDYNMTVKGDVNMTTLKDFNISAKNMNQSIRGNIDTQAQSQTTKLTGGNEITSQGSLSIAAQGGVSIISKTDSVAISANKQIGMHAENSDIITKSGGKTSIKSKDIFSVESEGKATIKGDQAVVESSGSGLSKAATLKGDYAVIEATSPNEDPPPLNLRAKGAVQLHSILNKPIKSNPSITTGGETGAGGNAATPQDPETDFGPLEYPTSGIGEEAGESTPVS